ncbi:MAG: hypothetical protein QXX01_01855 [Candidatus Aenigmatarchaeota archaeon]|nr:hypothetical protein [Candidatus Aenigmarchaeota archaeon]
MTAKVALFTIGATRQTIENTIDKLVKVNGYVGKYNNIQRLLEDARLGKMSHVVISHPDALDNVTVKQLKELNIIIITFKELDRIL